MLNATFSVIFKQRSVPKTFAIVYHHSVWKSAKKSHSTLRAKRATFTLWVDKSLLKMPKMVNFGELLKIWSYCSNSVTRQVTLNMTKIGGKSQKWKNSNATFWVILKHCEYVDSTYCSRTIISLILDSRKTERKTGRNP